MKDTLIKITVYMETTVGWTKLRIKSMIWNKRKKKSIKSEQQEEKRIKKKLGTGLGTSGATLNVPTYES